MFTGAKSQVLDGQRGVKRLQSKGEDPEKAMIETRIEDHSFQISSIQVPIQAPKHFIIDKNEVKLLSLFKRHP